MKKIISVVLALTMIMMLGVCAFATDVTGPSKDNTSETKNTDIQVKTFLDPDNTDGYESYTVTIPAAITLEWEVADADIVGNAKYTVDRQLKTGATLKVGVVAHATDGTIMENADLTDNFSLNYAIAGGETTTFDALTHTTAADNTKSVTVDVVDWKAAPIDTYTGHVTYVVEYVAPTTTP